MSFGGGAFKPKGFGTGTTTPSSGGFGAKPATGFGIGSTYSTTNKFGGTSTTSSTTTNSLMKTKSNTGNGTYSPPFNSATTEFKEQEVEITSANNTNQKITVMNITAMPQFKNCTPEELRFYDYLNSKKIETPEDFRQDIKGGLQAVGSIGGNTAQAGAAKPTLQGIQGKTLQSATSTEKEPTINANELKFPTPKPGVVLTAAEYFKSKAVPIIKEEDEINSIEGSKKYHRNYNSLFTKRNPDFSDGYEFKKITPLKFTSDMLKCAFPKKSERFLPYNPLKTIPPIDEISGHIDHFKVSREGYADIEFMDTIDISNIDIQNDIEIKPCFVNFYPYLQQSQKPASGNGMNVRTRITMYNCWPIQDPNVGIRQRFKPDDEESINRFSAKLQAFCATKAARFVCYDYIRGVFSFDIFDVTLGPYEAPDSL